MTNFSEMTSLNEVIENSDKIAGAVAFTIKMPFMTTRDDREIISIPDDNVVTRNPETPLLWLAESAYYVPKSGIYSVNLSFVKDPRSPAQGSNDDAFVRVIRKRDSKLTELCSAWAGATTPQQDREAASHSAVYRLRASDTLQLELYCQGQPMTIRNLSFSLHSLDG